MGIQGLLYLLKPITRKEHISTFRNKTIAVDALPWLHKGCYGCAMQLNQNIHTTEYISYILEMADLLLFYQIKCIFIFDGRTISSKAETHEKRRQSREQYKQKGMQLLKQGNYEQGKKLLSRSISITEQIRTTTMSALRSKGVQFMVAPYEADCQIAKLRRLGIIDAAISQDSDLLVYGVNTIFKLSQNGECDYVDISESTNDPLVKRLPQVLRNYLQFNETQRIQAVAISGSDYNSSPKGIGLKTSINLLKEHGSIQKVFAYLRQTDKYTIADNYEEKAINTKHIFLYSTVYNNKTSTLETLSSSTGIPQEQLLSIVGQHYPYDESVMKGDIDSRKLEPRNIFPMEFSKINKQVNKENVLLHQAMHRQRKKQEESLKESQLNRIYEEEEEKGEVSEEHFEENQKKQPIKRTKEPKERKPISAEDREANKAKKTERRALLISMMNQKIPSDIFLKKTEPLKKQPETEQKEQSEEQSPQFEIDPEIEFYLRKLNPNIPPKNPD